MDNSAIINQKEAMPKKRRKLNKPMEASIADAQRKVELVVALINDITEEDIQTEFKVAFDKVRYNYAYIKELYDQEGYTEATQEALKTYSTSFAIFEEEYEI